MNEFRFNYNNNNINKQNYPVKSNNNNVVYNILFLNVNQLILIAFI